MIYPVVYLDPPWPYEVYSTKGQTRSAESHYGTMSWERLFLELGGAIRQVTTDNAAIIIWCVPPSYDTAFRMAEHWGLQYKTKLFCWVKQTPATWGAGGAHTGMGHYTRANTEDAFLFTWRGKENPKRQSKGVPQVGVTTESYLLPNTKHSQKPNLFRERIEQLFKGPYLEVFARTRRVGWDAVGNQLDGLDIMESLVLVRDNKPLPRLAQDQEVLC